MVRNVVNPAMSSVLISVLFFFNLNNFSKKSDILPLFCRNPKDQGMLFSRSCRHHGLDVFELCVRGNVAAGLKDKALGA